MPTVVAFDLGAVPLPLLGVHDAEVVRLARSKAAGQKDAEGNIMAQRKFENEWPWSRRWPKTIHPDLEHRTYLSK